MIIGFRVRFRMKYFEVPDELNEFWTKFRCTLKNEVPFGVTIIVYCMDNRQEILPYTDFINEIMKSPARSHYETEMFNYRLSLI